MSMLAIDESCETPTTWAAGRLCKPPASQSTHSKRARCCWEGRWAAKVNHEHTCRQADMCVQGKLSVRGGSHCLPCQTGTSHCLSGCSAGRRAQGVSAPLQPQPQGSARQTQSALAQAEADSSATACHTPWAMPTTLCNAGHPASASSAPASCFTLCTQLGPSSIQVTFQNDCPGQLCTQSRCALNFHVSQVQVLLFIPLHTTIANKNPHRAATQSSSQLHSLLCYQSG